MLRDTEFDKNSSRVCVNYNLELSFRYADNSRPDVSGVDKGGSKRPSPPILQTKHKHTFKLHEICQFVQFIFLNK